MSFTAGEVINHARDLHPALSPTNAPNAIAFRYLSRKNRELIREIVRRVPANEMTTLEVPLPLAVFEDGVDLTSEIPGGWLDIPEGFFHYSNNGPNPAVTVRAAFVPWEQKDMAQPLPAYTFRDNVLYFLGGEQYYSNFDLFRLDYTPLPADTTSTSFIYNLPDDARECMASGLAAFWLMRMVGSPNLGVERATAELYLDMAADDERRFLARIWNLAARQDYRVRDVTQSGSWAGGW